MNVAPLIAVDIGNSSTKVGLFDVAQLRAVMPQPQRVLDFPTGAVPPAELNDLVGASAACWRIVSVNRSGRRALDEWFAANRPNEDIQTFAQSDLPISVSVERPELVGVDRLAAALAAWESISLREPGRAAIVVGAGTAMTVDLISGDGKFQGGAIVAGFRMQAEALFQKAELLPLAHLTTESEPPSVIGKNTEQAIRSGLFWGAVGAARELIGRMSDGLTPAPQVFVTGGDLKRLAPLVSGQARFVPNMVLAGIAIAARGR
jgi:type III pantothenate kinase